MNALAKKSAPSLKVIEYANRGGWMLGTYSEKGYLATGSLFLVCDHAGLSHDRLSAEVERINRSAVMGRGYAFVAFDEPCLGCEVVVSEGWELSSQAMKNNFLHRFIKALALGEDE